VGRGSCGGALVLYYGSFLGQRFQKRGKTLGDGRGEGVDIVLVICYARLTLYRASIEANFCILSFCIMHAMWCP
jgi:hypothetical protein